jgi:Zn-dependent peptidase ImmA (M78 family)
VLMADNNQIQVNHEVLIWARESVAMTRSQASEKARISDHKLLQLERGERKPSIDELRDLSKIYKRSIATLLLSVPPAEKPLPKDRRTVDSKELGHFHFKTIMAIRKARALALSYIELKKEFGMQIPRIEFAASLNDNPRETAKTIRQRLNLAEVNEMVGENHNLALEEYCEKVESLGIAVFQLSLTEDNLRGFSITDEAIPIIGIKRGGESATAKNFTLFHELGHILLRDQGACDLSGSPNTDIEKWCNAFAAEVLIPAIELLQLPIVIAQNQTQEKEWKQSDLAKIGEHFHVGPLAILRALLQNGLTTPAFYSEKHLLWNRPAFGRSKHPEGRNIPKETLKEKGRTYVSLAFSAFDQKRIDLKDLSDFLGIRLSYIPKTRQLLNAG